MSRHILDTIRARNPCVLTLANTVTSGKVADALSALGVSPIMSYAPEEAEELVTLADAVTINLGTWTEASLAQARVVAQAALAHHKPLVLDPVAAGLPTRNKINSELLEEFSVTALRGNAGEIAALAGVAWHPHGIDAGEGEEDIVKIAQRASERYHTLVVLSGVRDVIVAGARVLQNVVATPMLARNVGSGDILSSVLAATLSVADDKMEAGLTATQIVSVAGVRADQGNPGLGTWQVRFLDELTQLTSADIERSVKMYE